MLGVTIGLSKRKKVPVFYILDYAYLPHRALRLLWRFRWLNEIEHNKEYTIFEAKGNTVKLPNEHLKYLIFDEWKIWEKYYIPHFSLQGKTVLDVGAGCGETALLFFLHGACKVIAVEPTDNAVECLKENAERNNWDVKIVAEPFSLEHLKFDYDFMKMDGEGCEELLLSLPRIDKPCVIEVHSDKLLNEFIKKGYLKIHSMRDDVYIVKNKTPNPGEST